MTDARMGFFPIVGGEKVSVTQAGAFVVGARNDIDLKQGGAQIIGAGNDLRVTQGGGWIMGAGNRVTVNQGGAFLAAGRNVEVNGSYVGVAIGRVSMDSGSKSVIGSSGSLLIGTFFGALVSLLFIRMSRSND